MTDKTKTIKVDTRCWWVTPQRIHSVNVVEVADVDHFVVEWYSNRIGINKERATVRMDQLIGLNDYDTVRKRMRCYIETAESELDQFEREAKRIAEQKPFADDEPAVRLNEVNRIKGNPEQGRDGRDPEIAAMETIVDVLSPLTTAQLVRIIDWTKDRFEPPRATIGTSTR